MKSMRVVFNRGYIALERGSEYNIYIYVYAVEENSINFVLNRVDGHIQKIVNAVTSRQDVRIQRQIMQPI